MKVIRLQGGFANTYIAYKDGSGKAFAVDPCTECGQIMAYLDEHGIEEVTHILLTHGHFDHIISAAQLRTATGAKVCIHERDLHMLKNPKESLAFLFGMSFKSCEADIVLNGGEDFEAAGMQVHVLHAPGHSGGSVCYIVDGAMFSGDTLFHMSCGRTDLPGSDPTEYHETLQKVIKGLTKDYDVYPGHGPETTLYREFSHNPYLKGTI